MIYTLESIDKSYRTRNGAVRALAGFSLGVQAGDTLALIGRSGAGKTTLFRLLNATLRPTGGKLYFDGQDVSRMHSRELRSMRRKIGTIYQQHHLVPSLSVMDNTLCGRLGYWSLPLTIRSALKPAREDAEKALFALESVGLADKRKARADELSGGQQQRLAIARVLMQDPDVILADEPVASLDPGLAESIASLLMNAARARPNRTLIVTLHHVELALRHFPRIVAMHEGRLVFDVPAADISRGDLNTLFAGPATHGTEENWPNADPWSQPRCAR